MRSYFNTINTNLHILFSLILKDFAHRMSTFTSFLFLNPLTLHSIKLAVSDLLDYNS